MRNRVSLDDFHWPVAGQKEYATLGFTGSGVAMCNTDFLSNDFTAGCQWNLPGGSASKQASLDIHLGFALDSLEGWSCDVQ